MTTQTRICKQCGVEYPLTSEFWYTRDKPKPRFSTPCKTCACQNRRDDYVENRDKRLATQSRYYQRNKEAIDRRNKTYQKTHKEQVRRYHRNYAKNNPEKLLVWRNRTRTRNLDLPNTLTAEQINVAFAYFRNTCAVCGNNLGDSPETAKRHLDHWIALADPRSDNPGTVAANMLPLCIHCNLSKKSKDPEQWLVKRFGGEVAGKILARIQAYFAEAR
jgi:hypothetical protein